MAEPIQNPNPNPNPAPTPAPASAPQPATTADVVSATLAALDARTRRAETGVLRSMAEQYGMTEADLSALLEGERQRRASQLTPQAQQLVETRLNAAKNLVITAEIKSLGASMGLLDADAAMMLMDRSKITVDDAGNVTGAGDALSALKTAKPYLFRAAPVSTGMRQGGGDTKTTDAAVNDALRAAFGKGE